MGEVQGRPAAERGSDYRLRNAVATDLPAIRDIYDYYVENTTVTFDEDGVSLDGWRDKLANLNGLGLPFIVAEATDGTVLGYALVMPWKPKKAYRYTVENSIYLGREATGRGIGPVLLAELLDRSTAAGLKQVIGVIAEEAEVSIRLHERFGFEEIGRMHDVGFKFGRWLGIRLLQKSL